MAITTSDAEQQRAAVPASPTRPARPRSGAGRRLLPYAVVILIVIVWWAVTTLGLVPAAALPTPSAVVTTGWGLIVDGQLPGALGASLLRVLVGSAVGVVSGVALGVVAGLSVVGQLVVDRPLQMLRMIPFNALTPLFILLLGIDEPMKVIVVAYAVAVPLYINTFAGIRSVDAKLVEVAAVYGVPRAVIAIQVLLRGALPSVLTGLRFSLGIAWIALITVEVINTTDGLGFILGQAQQFARIDIVLVVVIVYGVLGAVTDWIVRLLERRLLRWRAAYDGV